MSQFLTPVQSALYSRLTSEVVPLGTVTAVYDDVPNLPEGMPDENFPYIVIGEATDTPFDTDDTLGGSVVAVLHVWSRYQGRREAKQVLGQIYDALNRQSANLSATGYRFVDCLHEFSETFDDPDGATRHGVCRYRLTLEQE